MIPALLLQQSPGPGSFFAPLILMVVVFYLVLFLPMRRRQRKTEEMLRNLENGDQVVTNGGLIGTVVGFGEEDSSVTLRIKPDNVKLQFSRSAVTGLLNLEEKKGD